MTKRCSDDIIEIEIEAVQKQVCSDDSLCGQVAEFVSQSIDIGEPIENLKKLLEPRLQCSLENHHICLQDIQLDPTQSLFDQGVKTDGIVQLSVQVISRQGVEPRLNILEIIKPVETVEVVIDPDAAHHEDMTATQVITVEGGKALSLSASDEASEQVTRWAAALEGFRSEQEREGIPFDPVEWTSAQVLHWAAWVTKEFQLGPLIHTEGLQRVDGAQLCSLNQELFLERVAHGEILWSHLELLRKYVQASQDHVGAITTVCIEPQYQIIPGPIVSGSPGTISVIGGAATATATATATKSIKPNRAPRISGEDRSSPGNRTGNNGQIQLWQFLLELLTDREARDCICWVGEEGEFKLNQPEHVAQRWGQRKNKPTMNYEKLSRALRYYYDGDMICKVQGKRFVYKFVCDLKTLIGYSASELNRLVLEAQQREERRLSRIHIHQQQ